MRVFLAGITAALVAWPLNRMAVGLFGRPAIIFLVPFIEEGLKTFAAISLGAGILPAHILFGSIEAVYEASTRQDARLTVVLSSLAGHSLFGLVTVLARQATGKLLLAAGVAYLLHMFWNSLLTNLRRTPADR
ncbi:MAG: hypothetical protein ACOX8W_06255 [bacterium]|jgi:hypothetical protein